MTCHYCATTAEGLKAGTPQPRAAPTPAPSLGGLRKSCGLAGKFTKCCSFVLVAMGTPLTTTLHVPCGVTVTLPSEFVKEACLSEILKRQEFVSVSQRVVIFTNGLGRPSHLHAEAGSPAAGVAGSIRGAPACCGPRWAGRRSGRRGTRHPEWETTKRSLYWPSAKSCETGAEVTGVRAGGWDTPWVEGLSGDK